MRENGGYVEPFVPLHVYEDYRRDEGKARFDIHPALCHVDFRAAAEFPGNDHPPVENDAYFRQHHNAAIKDETPVDAAQRAYVGSHPLAARSFATATPISNMALFSFIKLGETTVIDLNRAITVLDVLSAIHQEYVSLASLCKGALKFDELLLTLAHVCSLDVEVSVRDVRFYLGYGPITHSQCVTRAKWSIEDAFEKFQSPREILTLW